MTVQAAVPDPEAAVRRSLIRRDNPDAIGVAFSGGADSTALLLILHRLKAETGFRLFAYHVNHGLRTEADAEEKACREFCFTQDIPFRSEKLTLRGKSEEECRALRYAALRRMAVSDGCGCVALGHHSGDQAELVIMRLMQGSLTGMAGMREWTCFPGFPDERPALWRPLLTVSHEQLCAFLTENRVTWCEDTSNYDTGYTRNFIRHEILPRLAARQDHLTGHILKVADALRQTQNDLDLLAGEFLTENSRPRRPCPCIRSEAFERLPLTLRKAAIKRFLGLCGVSPHLPESTMNAAAGLSKGRKVDWDGVIFYHSGPFIHLIDPREISVFTARDLTVCPCGDNKGDGIRQQAVPAGYAGSLTVRGRRDGDRLTPFGMRQSRKLQDYLTDRRIPLPFRDHIPLVCAGDEILWVVGVGCSEKCRTDGGAAVMLHYTGQLPTEDLPGGAL